MKMPVPFPYRVPFIVKHPTVCSG